MVMQGLAKWNPDGHSGEALYQSVISLLMIIHIDYGFNETENDFMLDLQRVFVCYLHVRNH